MTRPDIRYAALILKNIKKITFGPCVEFRDAIPTLMNSMVECLIILDIILPEYDNIIFQHTKTIYTRTAIANIENYNRFIDAGIEIIQ
jgi:hypothetical protein